MHRSAPIKSAMPSFDVLLDREMTALDAVMGEVRTGFRSAAHYDDLADRACIAADAIKRLFRGPVR